MQDLPFNTRVLTRHNNLNFLRFIAAFSVIFSHSFTVSEGSDALGTPLDVITQNRLSIGGIAVAFFFLISGILIAKSCETHSSVRKFFKNRLLRIFPELIVCVLCSVFILGLGVTTYSFDAYVTSADTYRYLLNICLIPIHALPGVFENNPYPHVVMHLFGQLPQSLYVTSFALACISSRILSTHTCALSTLLLLYLHFFTMYLDRIRCLVL